MNNNITLVVADDHPLLLSGLVGQLKDYNYDILATAEHGAKALELILDLKPSIAILDEEMPFLTGFEVIKKCKELAIDTEFIILTSHKEKSFIFCCAVFAFCINSLSKDSLCLCLFKI